MTDENLECTFCGKRRNQVAKLIAGPSVYICDECVDLCHGIVEDDRKTEPEREAERLERLRVKQEADFRLFFVLDDKEKLTGHGVQLNKWSGKLVLQWSSGSISIYDREPNLGKFKIVWC